MLKSFFSSRNVFFSSRNKPPPAPSAQDRQHALSCIPMQHPDCLAKQNDEGLLLHYSVQAKPWFQKLFSPGTTGKHEIIQKKLQLDTMGSTVWQMIDGQKSVKQICREFEQIHQLDPREAEISVTSFIEQLGKRSLVALKEAEKSSEF